ncbi:carnitine O-acetyltransferase-like [Babylonia areolata]|uniref:carnitine O-acetyltransferase-like n=1 Tax=Babylonia areolata TaxID=304850 RepID=UPI003FD388C4
MWNTVRQIRLVKCLSPAVRSIRQEIKVTQYGRRFSTQSSLPRLPVPPLQQTMEKYLRSVRPLVSDEEFAETQEVVKKFLQSPGPELQEILEKRAQEKTNWLSDWWKRVAYLEYRIPLVVNFNPAVGFPRQDYRGKDEQLRFAAKFTAGVLDYKAMIDDQSLPEDTLGGKPLCMSQYYNMFSACRIPGLKKDTHVVYPGGEADSPRHIIVIHNNHMFSVDVYGQKGRSLSVDQLYQQFQRVTNQSQHPTHPIGLLTTMDRDSWGAVYADLVKNKKNKAAMQEIQRSIFVLCLDKPVADGNAPFDRSLLSTQMLHGGGAQLNSGNRWFDKTMQYIIGADGMCGMNYEHTTAEGPPVVAIMDYVLDSVVRKREGDLPAADVRPPRRLDLALTAKTHDALRLADQELTSLVNDIQITVFTFEDFGKDFPKKCRMSPDAFIQVALQLAYYRLFRQPCATYESGSLRRFQLGRTDTIRSCSVDSHAFTQGMENKSLPAAAKVALLHQAVKSHRNYTNEVVAGQGIDRHLLGFKLAALESGQNIPALHLDTSFTESTYFRLSTSQVATKHDAVMSFGPSVPDGFGGCYNPQTSSINFSLSALHVCSETDSDQFANVLKQSLLDMRDLLLQVPEDSRGG